MRIIVAFFGAALLAACSSTPDPEALVLNREGGSFSGKAGANWTDEDLRSNAFRVLCPTDETVTDLEITRTDGAAEFTGRCV